MFQSNKVPDKKHNHPKVIMKIMLAVFGEDVHPYFQWKLQLKSLTSIIHEPLTDRKTYIHSLAMY